MDAEGRAIARVQPIEPSRHVRVQAPDGARSGSSYAGRWGATRRRRHPSPRSARDLQDNSLCRLSAVRDLASHSYRGRPGAEALGLRDLVEVAVGLAGDLLAPPYEKLLRRWVETGNIAAVAREMGKNRSHLSRDYRPRVVIVVTDVFMRLTGNVDRRRRGVRSNRGRPPLRSGGDSAASSTSHRGDRCRRMGI